MQSPRAASSPSILTRAAPPLVFAVLTAATLLVWRQQVAHERELVLNHARDVAVQASRRLQILVDSALTSTSVFARRWSTHEKRDFSQQRFRDFAAVLVAEIPGIHDLRLIAPDRGSTWRVRDSPDSAWEHLRGARTGLIHRARKQRRVLLSAPVTLARNRSRFFALLPLWRGREYLGTLAVEFQAEHLIGAGFHDRIRSEFSFEVTDGGALLYSYAPEGAIAATAAFRVEQVFPVRNRHWHFTTSPLQSALAGVGWWATASIPALGLALSAALSGLLYLMLRRMRLYREARDQALSEVAERQKAQEALRASEARYGSVFDSATEGLIVVDDDDCIVEANPVACQMHGYEPGQLNGTSVLDIIAPDQRHQYASFKERREQRQGVRLDSVHQRADGSRFEVEVRASRFRRGNRERVLVIVNDVTERHQTVQRLALLSRKIMLAQEEERSRVSRELHDELGQLLTAAQLELGWLQKRDATDETSLRDATGQSIRLVEQAADELRRICRGLRPPVLDDIGLEPAVLQLIREFEERSSSEVELLLNLDDETPLVPETALCVYRVLQESLNNVSRHAEARRVSISLVSENKGALLVVRDDGKGFDPATVNGSRGCGLEGMQERANLVNGRLEIIAQPGRGTEVRLRVAGASEDRRKG